ncbi:FCS-Like Zinc finger 17-like [Salvia hispanica]|uniref:FCS-Like Zinc finger 17-like n=1 Tax=Salvia hispanica TaxID=49212 RepID=UPI0020097680|nr:FCS-Like Zinc finger 17-like [Salvia hispanica]
MFAEIWSKKRLSINSNCEGLRFLTKIEISNSNVVVKPIFLLKPKSKSPNSQNCYLKLCHLCIKPLNFDKEIFMYKGDLGFCSVECRDRQIYMDETQQMEANTKRILSSFRQRYGGGRCETTKLLEDYRRRRRSFTPPSERVVFSYS